MTRESATSLEAVRMSYILGFQEMERGHLGQTGSKGANLGELARISELRVPDGFCVTTEAYREVVGNRIDSWLDELAQASGDVSELCAKIRQVIESAPFPDGLASEITGRVGSHPYAVRSSATAEDLPTASFAGQQDTYLNVVGLPDILRHISRCWASLFTERAVIYRRQNGFDHRQVSLAVVVQRMVFPQISGVMFTADPVTSNRKVVSIDASFGLGEALVSGLVSADHYKVRDQRVVETRIATKKLAVYALAEGGTESRPLSPEEQKARSLTEDQVIQLAALGRRIEAHFGAPQDIEWCLADDDFFLLQSRPITTLFPLPIAKNEGHHVYVSVGHQQMMTDAMKPLGLSVWLATAGRPMDTAGGRLFVNVGPDLASPQRRNVIVNVLGKSDPLVRDAITTVLERPEFAAAPAVESGPPPANYETKIEYDPEIVPELIGRSQAAMEELKQNLREKSGAEVVDFILEDLQKLKSSLSAPQSFAVIMTGMNAAYWLNEKLEEWLGEKNAADILSQSLPDNVTSEMGLALMKVADALRPHPDVIHFLQNSENLEGLQALPGGREVFAYLDQYGMRCAGEIDITRPRWSEEPLTLIPLLLSHIRNFEAGAGQRKFEQGLQQAAQKEQELLERLRRLPGGEDKAAETKRMIHLVRHYAGYREYPKYAIVSRYFLYKQALLKEAERLVRDKVISEKEDIFYLSLEELREAITTQNVDVQIIGQRKAEFKIFEKLTPPRVMTWEGEMLNGKFHRTDLPEGAIAGLAVSGGTVEGRARVLLDMKDADIEEGDILVTAFTDPSWTPLFVSIAGLVTEVGGLMTHGAVIAREYGLPAIVGVDDATRLIRDGQRIRVHGTEGYLEIL